MPDQPSLPPPPSPKRPTGPLSVSLDRSRRQLDRLLDELIGHVEQVRASREQMQGLLEAVVTIASGMSLNDVLQRVVESACDLVDAQYGALAVPDADPDRLRHFVYTGIDEATREAIGTEPESQGLVRKLIREARPLRLDDLTKDPEFCGFPPNHPTMKTFLGTPIIVRGEAYGRLYLTEKRGGRVFSAEDEELVIAMAAAAGIAIDNAQLFERSELQRAWLEASSAITTATLQGAGLDDILSMVVRGAHDLADVDEAGLRMPDDTGENLILVAGYGPRTEDALPSVPLDSLIGRVYRSGTSAITPNLAAEEGPACAELSNVLDVGPLMAVPLVASGQTVGVLSLSRRVNRSPFTKDDLLPLETFGAQAALALEVAHSRDDHERMLLFEDRDRIARDLHDVVVQRLFAAGLALESVRGRVEDAEASRRLADTVDELDGVIREIRSVIFGLQRGDQASLRADIRELAQQAHRALGFTPTVQLRGEIDARIGPELGDDIRAVVTEALSNAAQHAGATSVELLLAVDDHEVQVRVADDGAGLPPEGPSHRSGLANIAERATMRGGHASVVPNEPTGTVVEWTVPLIES